MITKIHIENLGLIANAECEFLSGFTVITGETGAGKSFFCKAVEMGMGARLSKLPSEKTIVEVEAFDHIFRRIADAQKSRFFIDDIPESLEFAQNIIEGRFFFHRQHDTHFLSSSAAPVALLDDAMGEKELQKKFSAAFSEWKKQKKIQEGLEKDYEKQKEHEAFWRFSLEQMQDISFTQEQIAEAEAVIIQEAENQKIYEAIAPALQALSHADVCALSLLQTAEDHLKKIDSDFEKPIAQMTMQIAEIVKTLEKTCPTPSGESEKSKLFLANIQKWCKQHSVVNAHMLLEKKQKLMYNLENIETIAQGILSQQKKVDECYALAFSFAKTLSEKRKIYIPYFEATIQKSCQALGMPPAQFSVLIHPTELCSSGIENIDFLFSANQNQALLPLAQVASGGEKSRIMLALYQFTPENSVIIFDEIDTGVSGSIAEKMAKFMHFLSEKRQIIAISHLAQIAAHADHHIVVQKTHFTDKTITTLKTLEENEKIDAIAQLISGNEITDEARNNAKKLLEK